MTVPVPYPLPVTSGWQLADWLDRTFTSTPAGPDGVATITLDALPSNERWLVTHMVAGCTSTASTQMRLYLDSAANGNLRDGTDSGNFDVADWAQFLMVPPGRGLVARWTGADPGSTATLTLQANILRTSS